MPRDVDMIVVAGDASAPLGDALAWLRVTFGSSKPIVYVPGNHDYYQHHGSRDDVRQTMDQILGLADGCAKAELFGIHLLSDDTVTLAGVRFVGATLWTDYRVEPTISMTRAMHAAEKSMNDYKAIRRASSSRPTKGIRPADLLLKHRASVDFLDAEISVAFDGPTVVVTHHAPHPRSLQVPFSDLNPCYASDLRRLIERHAPALWCHGHIHAPSD